MINLENGKNYTIDIEKKSIIEEVNVYTNLNEIIEEIDLTQIVAILDYKTIEIEKISDG